MNILLKEKNNIPWRFFFLVNIRKLWKYKFPYTNQLQTQICTLIKHSPVNKTCQKFSSILLCGEWCFVKTEVLHGNGFILMEIEWFWCTFVSTEFGWKFRFQRNIVSGHFCPVDQIWETFLLPAAEPHHSPAAPGDAAHVQQGNAPESSKTLNFLSMQTSWNICFPELFFKISFIWKVWK